MPIYSEVNTDTEKVKLGKSAILLLTQKDYATINKIPTWLFGHFDEDAGEEDLVGADDPAIFTIVESLKELFNLSMDPEKNSNSPLLRQIASTAIVKQGL